MLQSLPSSLGKNSYEKNQNKKGFMSSEQISADFSMHVFQTGEADLSFFYIPHRSQPTKYPNVLLIKPSIAAKRERGETWKKICYGS